MIFGKDSLWCAFDFGRESYWQLRCNIATGVYRFRD